MRAKPWIALLLLSSCATPPPPAPRPYCEDILSRKDSAADSIYGRIVPTRCARDVIGQYMLVDETGRPYSRFGENSLALFFSVYATEAQAAAARPVLEREIGNRKEKEWEHHLDARLRHQVEDAGKVLSTVDEYLRTQVIEQIQARTIEDAVCEYPHYRLTVVPITEETLTQVKIR